MPFLAPSPKTPLLDPSPRRRSSQSQRALSTSDDTSTTETEGELQHNSAKASKSTPSTPGLKQDATQDQDLQSGDDGGSSRSIRNPSGDFKRKPAQKTTQRAIKKRDYELGDNSDSSDSDSDSDSDSTTSDDEAYEGGHRRRHKRRKREKQGSGMFYAEIVVALLLLGLGAAYAYVIINKNSSNSSLSSPTASGDSTSASTPAASPATPGSDSQSQAQSQSQSQQQSQSLQATSSAGVATAKTTGATGSNGSYTLAGISKNKIGIGFLPDSYSRNQSMAEINTGLGINSSFYGWYAHLDGVVPWTGGELLAVKADVLASGAIFQPAVMPTGGWAGLTAADSSQATAIAAVMKQFTDEGIEVWLRFGHEVNYYQGDETDFKAAWAVISAAVKNNTLVKMFFTPNIEDLTTYQKYYPDDADTVDIIGIDYYVSSGSTSEFITAMQPFHDAYCLNSSTSGHQTIFAIGETGLGQDTDIQSKLVWLDAMTNAQAKAALPKHAGGLFFLKPIVAWFNYMKGVNFYLYDGTDDDIGVATKAWLQNGTVASGVTVP